MWYYSEVLWRRYGNREGMTERLLSGRGGFAPSSRAVPLAATTSSTPIPPELLEFCEEMQTHLRCKGLCNKGIVLTGLKLTS